MKLYTNLNKNRQYMYINIKQHNIQILSCVWSYYEWNKNINTSIKWKKK